MIKLPAYQCLTTSKINLNHKSNRTKAIRIFRGGLFLFVFLLSFMAQAQISYEKGYFLDNSGKKTDCLIRNVDWMVNPTDFEYKLSENGEAQTATLDFVKEFGIIDKSKYINATVKLDSSSDNVDKLGMDREPNFSVEKLFLKVLVEGKANLYMYEDQNGRNYFYKTSISEIQPLIFKRYITDSNKIGENNRYKQQLWVDLNYPDVSQKKLAKLSYNQKELTNFFVKFNAYDGGEVVDFLEKDKKDLFNFTFRPGVRSSSLELNSVFSGLTSTKYDNELSLRVGMEIEGVMPFNKNKWALFIEPSYQYYKTEKVLRADTEVAATVDYKTIEVAFGARHYMYLNEKSKLFINAAYVLAVSNSSKIDYGNGFSIDLEKSSNAAFGLGYKYNDTYSLEFNYSLDRALISSPVTEAIYSSFSLIFGYTIF